VQHRFTRLFPHLRMLPYEQLLNHLGLWTLEERRNRADLIDKKLCGLEYSKKQSRVPEAVCETNEKKSKVVL